MSINFDTVYIFGDSFSDTGASGDQRTNGSTAAGYLAAALGSPLVLPTANNIGTKSINFAETSAKVNTQSANGPTSLTNQVNNFSQLVGNGSASFDSDDTLFFLAGGLNDRTTNPNNVINGYKQQVAELVSLGARFIEITLLPSEIPPFLVSADKFNDLYANLVAELNALYSHVSITLSDWGTYFDDIILNPSDYGMSNVTDAYLDVGQPGVDDPDTFFYYYPAHPSDAAHEIVGDKLYDETLTLTEMSPELQISGQGYEVTTFTHQNNSYDFTVSGGSLRQGTNVWTAVDIGTYVVTANTVLRFEFSSSDEGELHGVEFDNDGLPSGDYGFQLFGTQTLYHQDYNNYALSNGTRVYEIAVGAFFTGTFDSLVFFSDDDRERGSNSTFSNIELFEDTGSANKLKISGQSYNIDTFTHQNPNANHSLADGGASLVQGTNAWTTVDIDYVVTANTVLRFDFSSTDQGEIHGVEFDNDGLPSSNYGFQLFGTQTIYHQDFNNYRLSDGTKTYEIAVGEFFTGSFDSLVFFSDDDRVRGSNSTFSNIELFEDTGNGGGGGGGAPSKLKISGQSYDIAAFAHQNPNANHSLTDGGDTLVQGTNAWTEVDIDYVVTENTVLRFEFSSSDEGEIHGVEFDNDGLPSGDYGFQLFGTQTIYHQDFNNYRLSDGTKTYEIAVGEFFTGSFDSLVFFSDDDRGRGSNSTFSNIELFEDGSTPPPPPPPPATQLEISGQSYDIAAFAHQNPQVKHSLADGGKTLVQSTDAWTTVDIGSFVVTEDTVLRFDFSSTDEGEIHGVEFDNDDLPSGDYGFQLFGTQTIYRQDFNDYRLSDGTKTYEIAVGEFFTGTFDSLVFFSDDDRGRGSNSTFSNIELIDIA